LALRADARCQGRTLESTVLASVAAVRVSAANRVAA
jgi:hypothetical protein